MESKKLIPEEIIRKSIAFHDAKGEWKDFNYRLDFVANTAKGEQINTTIHIDNRKNYFRFIQKNANTDVGIEKDSCFSYDNHPINCERTKSTRNYWLFLWGQPMKLLDKGTVLDTLVVEENFEGYNCFRIKVVYPKDVWYYFFDTSNFALRGKEFYIDEEKNLGEKMILSGEVAIEGIKFPEKRSWINTSDSTYLQTDILVNSIKRK